MLCGEGQGEEEVIGRGRFLIGGGRNNGEKQVMGIRGRNTKRL